MRGQRAGELPDSGLDRGQAPGGELPVAGEVTEVVEQVADLVTCVRKVAVADRLRDATELVKQAAGRLRLDCPAIFCPEDGTLDGNQRTGRSPAITALPAAASGQTRHRDAGLSGAAKGIGMVPATVTGPPGERSCTSHPRTVAASGGQSWGTGPADPAGQQARVSHPDILDPRRNAHNRNWTVLLAQADEGVPSARRTSSSVVGEKS